MLEDLDDKEIYNGYILCIALPIPPGILIINYDS